MEEIIQVLIFIVIIASVIIGKYKEVNANRPGQGVQRPKEGNHEVFPNENDEDDEDEEINQDPTPVFDLEGSDDIEEGFGGEFSKRNQKEQKQEADTFSQSSPFDEFFGPFTKGLHRRQSPTMTTSSTEETTESTTEGTTFTGETTFSRETNFAQQNNPSSLSGFGTINHHTTTKHSEQTIVDPVLTSPTVPTKKKVNVRLKTKQEARQAFIYSEIFNRKYE